MPPRRSSIEAAYLGDWKRASAERAVKNYKKRTSPSSGSHTAPNTSASLMRLRSRAMRSVARSKNVNAALLSRNIARIEKMLRQVANYNARRRYKLVRQPNGSFSLASRT